MATRRAVFALLTIAGLASACGAGAGAAAGAARTPQTHTVTIDATSYQPKELVVRAGDTVVWVNKDLIPHTATAKGGTFDSQIIQAGASWTYTAAKKGVTDYACTFHPTMVGTLDVQ